MTHSFSSFLAADSHRSDSRNLTRPTTISKTLFFAYRETPRHAWCRVHRPEKMPPSSQYDQHTQAQGYEVEDMAKQFLLQRQIPKSISPSGTPGVWHWQDTFTDGVFLARTDAWWEDPKSNQVHLFEIKSSTRVKTDALWDLAFQVLCIEKTRPVESIWLVHLNKEYVRAGELDLDTLFVCVEVTLEVRAILTDVQFRRNASSEILTNPRWQDFDGCQHPKTCPCPDLCHPNLPEYPVTDLPGSRLQVTELLSAGITELKHVPPTISLETKQHRMVEAAQTGKPVVDPIALQRFWQRFEYPLAFLDYEAYNSALPLFDGTRPQQHVVFQYSLHVIPEPPDLDQPLQLDKVLHFEAVSFGAEDPSREVMRHLQEFLPKTGSIVVWNASFEAGRNREMAEGMLDLKPFLLNMNERMLDIADIFRLGLYVDRDFHGSWSIKNVLPVLAPELNYANLPIHKGDQALLAWWRAFSLLPDNPEIEQIKAQLLEYCQLDTWAMVRVWQEIGKHLNQPKNV